MNRAQTERQRWRFGFEEINHQTEEEIGDEEDPKPIAFANELVRCVQTDRERHQERDLVERYRVPPHAVADGNTPWQ